MNALNIFFISWPTEEICVFKHIFKGLSPFWEMKLENWVFNSKAKIIKSLKHLICLGYVHIKIGSTRSFGFRIPKPGVPYDSFNDSKVKQFWLIRHSDQCTNTLLKLCRQSWMSRHSWRWPLSDIRLKDVAKHAKSCHEFSEIKATNCGCDWCTDIPMCFPNRFIQRGWIAPK